MRYANRITSLIAPLCMLAAVGAGPAHAAIKMDPIEYKQDTTALEGFLVYDSALKGKKPGIFLAGDWMGVSDFAKRQAEKVAKLGYVVFVADIYGKGVHPKDQNEAAAQATKYKSNRDLMQARAKAGLAELMKSPKVDTMKTAAMGYCFGGTVVLELGRSGANLKGIATFHGGLDTPHPEQAKNIKGQVVAFHGADDPYVPAEQVKNFMDEMRKGGVDWRLTYYSGAVHAFTVPEAGNDPSKGAAYNAKADERSWIAMVDFYNEIFGAAKK